MCDGHLVRRLSAGGVATAVLFISMSISGGVLAQPVDEVSFTATADAQLLLATARLSPVVLFDPLVNPAISRAQVELDSLGASNAFAAHPDPGSTVLAVPGLLPILVPAVPTLPAYPLLVSSSYPTRRSSRLNAGPVVLTANSGQQRTDAAVIDGANRALAEAGYDPGDGEVVATAVATLSSFNVGGVLTLNGVRSFAEVRKRNGGELQRESRFEVASISILGTSVPLGLESLGHGDGDGSDVGASVSGMLAPLLKTLAENKVTIEPFPAEEFDDGVRSAGVRITVVVPLAPASGLESTTVTLTVGGVGVRVSSTSFDSSVAPIDDDIRPDASLLPTMGSGSGAPSSVPGVGPPDVSTRNAGSTGGSQPPSGPIAQVSLPIDASLGSFYPVLVVAGVGAYGISRLYNRRGRAA